MKAILEFTLPDEAQEYRDAVDGLRWRLAYVELLEAIRARCKYGELDDSANNELSAIRSKGYDIMLSWNLPGVD